MSLLSSKYMLHHNSFLFSICLIIVPYFISYYFIFSHVTKSDGVNLQTTTKTMPESNIHRGDADIGGVQNHSYYHNVSFYSFVSKSNGMQSNCLATYVFYALIFVNFQVYGMLMARSTYEGMAMSSTDKRPFVLTRAGFIGSQRYAATWTGDNLSNWEHMHMSLPMVLQLVSETFIQVQIVPSKKCTTKT